MLYVQDELSYDRYNVHADRIARIQFKATLNGGEISEAGVMAPVAQALKRDFPEVEDATRLNFVGSPKAAYGIKTLTITNFTFVDSNFFHVFTIPLLAGDPNTALSQPNTIVVSKLTAERFFGNEDPMGKVLTSGGTSFKITGVFDKIPANSHFHADLLASMVGWQPAQSDSWMMGTFYTYLLLKPGTDLSALQAKFPDMVKKYMGPQIQQAMGMNLDQFRTKGNKLGFVLQPLTSIHLHPIATNEIEPAGNATYVYVFGAIALFMLVIASMNFINLATASAAKRAKEVGVRKVIGSERSQLIKQFLIESSLVVLVALLLSLGLIYAVLPVFNQLSGKELVFVPDLRIIGDLVALGVVVSLFAGLYPAFVLSSFKPIAVLKGNLSGKNAGFGLRSVMVVFQFVISVSLIVGTVIVYQQMRYIQAKDLGYSKEQILTIPNSYFLGKNEKAFKDEMMRDPRIVSGTLSYYRPAGPSNSNNALVYVQGHDNTALRTVNFHVDEDYIPTFSMRMEKGRNFSKDMKTDSSAMILNETAVKALGLNLNNAVGTSVVQINSDRGTNFPYHVIGVVKDFNFQSLHQPITPLIMTLDVEGGVIFKVKTADITGLLASMKKEWDGFNTGEPFTYSFLDDLYNRTYAVEQKTGTILDIFAILTVIVACLGLFGLVTYTAEQRVKEIGIRKVLGASAAQITGMLSVNFLKLVLIACLIAFPVSWWAMNKWLQSFAYQMTMHWWVFALAGLVALIIALVTLSFQAIKAALANPVNSLRSE
jgi:putative ABC transport system permease protein